jgi:hypothetical protein
VWNVLQQIIVYCAVLCLLVAVTRRVGRAREIPPVVRLGVIAALCLAILIWIALGTEKDGARKSWEVLRRLKPGDFWPESFAERARKAHEEDRRCRTKVEDLQRRLADIDRQIERGLFSGNDDRLVALEADREEIARRLRGARREWALAAERARCAAEAEARGDLNVAPRVILNPEK